MKGFMKRDEMIEGVVLFLCGGVTVALSLQMPIGTFRMAGAGLFPLCLGIALMLLALLYLGNLLLQKGAQRASPGRPRVRPPGPPDRCCCFSAPPRSPSCVSTSWGIRLPRFS